MAIEAGDLDIERPGCNAKCSTVNTYTSGNLTSKAITYNDGTTTRTWTRTYTYNADGTLATKSVWVQS